MKGKKPGSFLQGPLTDQNTVRRIREKLNAQEAFYDEILNYDQDGSTYWISLAINPVFAANGKLEKYISIQANITDTKTKSQEFFYKLSAIDRANTVLELDLNGIILSANPNFCHAMGYDETQLIGMSLDKIIDPDFAKSREYQDVWQRLKAADFTAGEYQMKHRNGDEVWLNASFNPILGEDGMPTRYVQYGTDVTQQKTAVNAISDCLMALSKGDLTARVKGDFDSEFTKLQSAFNSSMERLQSTVVSIYQVADEVTEVANELVTGNQQLSARSESTAATLEETASSIEQLTSAAQQNSDNAEQALNMASASEQSAMKGQNIVEKAVAAMGKINESSKKIADIIGVIDEISFQTNLLALNASVEAARAGEQGRGFAVVAGEVRNLAQRSAKSAKEISELIKDSSNNVDEGAEYVNSSGDMLQDINKAILQVNEMIDDIANASRQQLAGITEINNSISNMDQITQQNVAMVDQSMQSSTQMLERVNKMRQDLAFFKVG